MSQKNKASEIGLGQARRICGISAKRRLEFIAEGLPLIFRSAQSLIKASQTLTDFSREAEILERHAEEECAKILILIDIVRCPPKFVASRIGSMMKWFYDHLARSIYAEAQSWKPVSMTQLQEYVDDERQSHYLEGEYGEYIMPNWTLFWRESSLYADVSGNEEGELTWNSPIYDLPRFGAFDPASYRIADALDAFGVFTLAGLKIVNEVWGKVNFQGDQHWGISRALCDEMVERLYSAGLIVDRAAEGHVRTLVNGWQMPMYHVDFSRISVSLDELRERRDRNLPYC